MNSGISKLNAGDEQDDFEKDLFKVFETTHEIMEQKVVKNIVHWQGQGQGFQSDNEKEEKQPKSQ